MDKTFIEMLRNEVPKFNRSVVDSLVNVYLDKSLKYIDDVIKEAIKHPDISYLGYEVCTPKEEYNEVTKNRSNKRTFDIAKSNLFLVKYLFAFKGEPLPPKYIYLPYVEEAGIIYLKGTKYHLNPVLSSKVITPSYNNLFVRLLRYKIIFNRVLHAIRVNGVREFENVLWANIYNRTSTSNVGKTTKAESTNVHYLFGKYGFDQTFNKYLGFVPVVGYNDINSKNYPPSKWVICESTQVRPKTFIGAYYEPTDIKIAVPRELWNQHVKIMVTGFFYIADHFPDRVNLEMLNNTAVWKILLGHILFSGNFGEDKLYNNINDHYKSIDEYIDCIVREKLHEAGYIVQDFYDLLYLISSEFSNFILNDDSTSTSMFGKNLEVLYNVLYEITSDIFKLSFKLSNPNNRSPLNMNNVIILFNKSLRMRGIRSLTSNRIVIESVEYPGDNKYMKLTSKVTDQESMSANKNAGKKRLSLRNDKHLDVSALEAGSILFLSKSDPSPCNKLNPYINVDLKTGTIVPNPKFDKLRAEVSAKLKGLKKF